MFLFGPQQTRGSSWTWETPGRIKALSYFPLSHTWCTESRHGTKTPPKNFFCRLIKLKSSSELLFFSDVTVRFYFRFGPAPLASVKKRKLTAVYGQHRPQKDHHREQDHRDSESEPLLGKSLRFIRFSVGRVLPEVIVSISWLCLLTAAFTATRKPQTPSSHAHLLVWIAFT